VSIEIPVPPLVPELISHLDVTPQNVVVRAGRAAGLIDFDLAGPTTRLLDAYNTAMHWVPLRPPADVWPTWHGVDQPTRLRIFADAYGLSDVERAALPDLGIARADVTWLRMRAAAETLGGGWARMWDEGVGDLIRRRQTWLATARDDLLAALR
jgi:Ser/Thr protein kinase RdoA (MazF antagonist)